MPNSPIPSPIVQSILDLNVAHVIAEDDPTRIELMVQESTCAAAPAALAELHCGIEGFKHYRRPSGQRVRTHHFVGRVVVD
jgi:hypothetical protein